MRKATPTITPAVMKSKPFDIAWKIKRIMAAEYESGVAMLAQNIMRPKFPIVEYARIVLETLWFKAMTAVNINVNIPTAAMPKLRLVPASFGAILRIKYTPALTIVLE